MLNELERNNHYNIKEQIPLFYITNPSLFYITNPSFWQFWRKPSYLWQFCPAQGNAIHTILYISSHSCLILYLNHLIKLQEWKNVVNNRKITDLLIISVIAIKILPMRQWPLYPSIQWGILQKHGTKFGIAAKAG